MPRETVHSASIPSPSASPAAVTERLAVEQVRQLADSGAGEAALGRCRALLLLHPLSAFLFFYAALLSRTLGRDEAAEADFRRAIYLCKNFVMAHYHLGLLLADTGHPGAGRRAIAEAARLAAARPADEVLPCGDGITAARLQALTRLDWTGDSAPVPP